MAGRVFNNTAYSFGQSPLTNMAPSPIVAKRAPTTTDFAPIGQEWIFTTNNTIYVLTSVTNNSANWQLVEASGGAGVFTTLTSSGNTTLGTGAGTTNTFGDSLNAVNVIGNATGNSTLQLNGIGSGISLNGPVTSDDGITIQNGNLVLSTATNKITLPGPVNIMSGAGAPANGLAVNVGDMYINTTAASATTRLYIATAASTWTNVTCAA